MRFSDGIAAQPESLAAQRRERSWRTERCPASARPGARGGRPRRHRRQRARGPQRRTGLARAGPADVRRLGRRAAGPEPPARRRVRRAERVRPQRRDRCRALGGHRCRRIGHHQRPDSPLAEVVDEVIALDSGPDSPVYTTGYTATLQAMGLLGEHWAGTSTDWAALPELAAAGDRGELSRSSSGASDAVRDRTHHRRRGAPARPRATAGRGRPHAARVGPRCTPRRTRRTTTCTAPWSPSTPQPPASSSVTAARSRLAQERQPRWAAHTLLITASKDVEPAGGLTVLRLPQPPSPLAGAVLEILPLQLLGWRIAVGRGAAPSTASGTTKTTPSWASR